VRMLKAREQEKGKENGKEIHRDEFG